MNYLKKANYRSFEGEQTKGIAGSWELNLDENYVLWSAEVYKIFEFPATYEVTPQTMLSYFSGKASETLYKAFNEAEESGQPFDLKLQFQNSKDKKKWVRIISSPLVQQGDVKKIVGTIEDITIYHDVELHLNKALEQLRESNERYEYVTRATSDAIWDFKPETGELFWGEGFKTLFGYKRNCPKMEISRWMDNIHPEDKERIEYLVSEMLAGSDTRWDQEYRFRKTDDTYSYVRDKAIVIRDERGRPVRVIGAMEDITKKKEEEQRLKLMESVVTHTKSAVLITEAKSLISPGNQKIVYVNDAYLEMTGYSAGELTGKPVEVLKNIYSELEDKKQLLEKIQRWEPVEVETVAYKKNGEKFWLHFSMSPVANEKGEYSHWISIERDITERKNIEIKQKLISEISHIFNRKENVRQTLKTVLTQFKKFKEIQLAEIWLTSHDKKRIDLAASLEKAASRFYDADNGEVSFAYGSGLPGKTWQSKNTQFWKNLEHNTSFLRNTAAKKAGLKTGYGIPIYYNEEVIGVLVLGTATNTDRPHFFIPVLEEVVFHLGEEIHRKVLEEELFRIFDSAPDVICKAGFDGYYKKVNPAMSELLGYSEQKLLSTPIIEFVHPEDRSKTQNELNALRDGKYKKYFKNRYLTKEGKVIWLSWTTKIFRDEEIIYSVAKNVTQQKKLEELLNQANRMAKIGSWEVDLIEGKIYFSDIARDIYELQPGSEPGVISGISFYKNDDRKRIYEAFKKAMDKGENWDLELQIVTDKGNERWVRVIGEPKMVDGKCIQVYGSIQDIHDRKEVELAYKKSSVERYKLLESIGDCFFAVNKDWTVTYWNSAAEELMGISRENVVGQNLWEVYPDAKDRDFYSQYQMVMKESKQVQFQEYYPGTNMWLDVSAYPSENGLSVFFKDITERKKSESKLQELNDSLEKKARELTASNAELEQFAFVASHDLQEPLRMVTGFLTQLEKKYDPILDEKGRKYIHYAIDGARRMRQIILDLLEFSRVGRVDNERVEVNLNEVMQEVLILNKKIISDTKASIEFDQLPVIKAARGPMLQLFQNLVNNSVKYHKKDIKPKVSITCREEDGYWKFKVQDNGIGIQPEYLEKVFNIFQRLHNKDEYEGNGMGLAICKKIVNDHGGEIRIESEVNKGSTFFFSIKQLQEGGNG